MNPKINKVIRNIDKTKALIAEQQTRLKELERLKTELENADIVAMVRGIDIAPADFEAFARAFMEQRDGAAVPDGFSAFTGRSPFTVPDDDDISDFDEKEDIDVEE